MQKASFMLGWHNTLEINNRLLAGMSAFQEKYVQGLVNDV